MELVFWVSHRNEKLVLVLGCVFTSILDVNAIELVCPSKLGYFLGKGMVLCVN